MIARDLADGLVATSTAGQRYAQAGGSTEYSDTFSCAVARYRAQPVLRPRADCRTVLTHSHRNLHYSAASRCPHGARMHTSAHFHCPDCLGLGAYECVGRSLRVFAFGSGACDDETSASRGRGQPSLGQE